jgi:hypothetical protein
LRYTLFLLMPALLPRGDESAMIFERVGIFFRLFLETLFELGVIPSPHVKICFLTPLEATSGSRCTSV